MPHLVPTGDPRVDATLRATVSAFEAAFPGRVRGYYVDGSHADGTGLPTSDLDLNIVFRDGFHGEAERAAAETLRDACARASELEYDAELMDEASLIAGASPTFKLGARLVYGEELRDAVPLVPLAEWTRDRMHTSCWRTIHLFGRPVPITLPLEYPDATAAYYGYDRRKTRLPGGGEAPGTRDLIRSTGWAATALVAWQAGQYVARKRDCHVTYRALIGDEWSDLLEDIYVLCRGQWQCLIPDAPAERARLRALCARTLGFERHFMDVYRRFLLAELRGGGDGARMALDVLERLPWRDDEIAAAQAAARADA